MRIPSAISTTVAQGANTASNFALLASVAHTSSSRDFGGFAIVYGIYSFCLSTTEAGVGETSLLVYDPTSSGDDRNVFLTRAMGSSVLFALLASVSIPIVGVVAGVPPPSVVIFALMAPILIAEDIARILLVAVGKTAMSAAIEVTWLAVQLLSLGILSVAGSLGEISGMLCWTIPGVLATAGCFRALNCVPALPLSSVRWLHAHRKLSASFVVESVALAGSAQCVLFGVGAFEGLRSTGGFRAAQTIFGPSSVLYLGLRNFGLSTAGRSESSDARRRICLLISLACGVLGSVYMVTVLYIPSSFGRTIFSSSWSQASALLLPFGIQKVAVGVSTGCFVLLRVQGNSLATSVYRVALAIVSTAGGFAGMFIDGVVGCVWGLAYISIAECLFLALMLFRTPAVKPPARHAIAGSA